MARVNEVVFETGVGWLRLQWSERGVCALSWAQPARVVRSVSDPEIRSVIEQVRRYAEGEPVRWQVRLDWGGATAFQRKVWRVLQRIPYGQTRSYVWVARQVGLPGAARAVGRACGANPIPIIVPCHRVVAGDGSLGGFSCGLKRKRLLLALEGGGDELRAVATIVR
ncbi:MAG: methylated-DNA--[protein]-cysteine S-methyltransferase [Verrucomicrobiae bacterium]|nr:methylated-DNA--[protein]-cysteine S-methyltransferase [Verrucomicrobiae bacterium]